MLDVFDDVGLTSLLSRNKDNRWSNVLLNKEFCSNGISLRVETRIVLLDEKHLVNKTIMFSLTLFKDAELAIFEEAWVPLGCQKLLTNRRVFMFSNTLMMVSSYIIWITQITCKRENNAFLIYNQSLGFSGPEVSSQGMLFIKQRTPSLNSQTDSILA